MEYEHILFIEPEELGLHIFLKVMVVFCNRIPLDIWGFLK